MSEIKPITPNLPLVSVAKVQRDEKRNKRPQKQPAQKTPPQAQSDDQPVQHIDEIV